MIRTLKFLFGTLLLLALIACAPLSADASILVDGIFSSGEWTGTPKTVNADPLAPIGNFGTPSNVNAIGYNIFTAGDANYFYVGLQALLPAPTGLLFTNLYFDLNPSTGSDLGFEVFNDIAFIPATGVPASSLGSGILHARIDGDGTTPAAIEVAFPWTVFTTDAFGLGYTPATSAVQLRLSQTFGYSVAGGTSYDPGRLGTLDVPAAAVPEASSFVTFAILGMIAAIGAVAHRSRAIAVA